MDANSWSAKVPSAPFFPSTAAHSTAVSAGRPGMELLEARTKPSLATSVVSEHSGTARMVLGYMGIRLYLGTLVGTMVLYRYALLQVSTRTSYAQ